MEKIMDQLLQWMTQTGIHLLCGLLVLFFGLKAVKIAVRFLAKNKRFQKIDKTLQSFLTSALKIMLNTAVVITAAVILGIPTTSFITLLASAGLAIGMAFQGSLSNFAGGVLLLLHKPFREGDYIESSAYAGTVKNLSVLYTTLNTYDNKQITVPNGILANQPIINYTAEELRRVDLTFSAAYGSDIEQVKKILLQTAKNEPRIKQEPPVFAGLQEQQDSALQFSLKVWCASSDYWTVYYSLTERVNAAFIRNGIEIPFPQLDVHVKQEQKTEKEV